MEIENDKNKLRFRYHQNISTHEMLDIETKYEALGWSLDELREYLPSKIDKIFKDYKRPRAWRKKDLVIIENWTKKFYHHLNNWVNKKSDCWKVETEELNEREEMFSEIYHEKN